MRTLILRLLWATIAACVLAGPASALTVLDWDCTSFTAYNTNIFASVASSPVMSSSTIIDPNHFYISTANPRSGAASPQHLRVQWNSANDWGGRLTFESPSGGNFGRHVFVTIYTAIGSTWTPYDVSGFSKQIILKTNTFLNNSYFQVSASPAPGVIKPNIAVQDCDVVCPGSGNLLQNMGHDVTLVPGSGYHRLDYELQLASGPAVPDGLMRLYIDGVQVANYVNIILNSPVGNVFVSVDVDFLGSGPGTFPMFRDMDRLWISTTAFDAGFGGGPSQLNPPSNPLICKGGGCTPASIPVVGGLVVIFWLRRRLKTHGR